MVLFPSSCRPVICNSCNFLSFQIDLFIISISLLDKPLHYLWVNASCHPEYGDIFGILPDNLPVLLLAKPKQRLFKTLHGKLTKEKVSDVISEIFLGREDLSPFSRFNEMLSVDCQETETSNKTDRDEAKNEESKTKKKKYVARNVISLPVPPSS